MSLDSLMTDRAHIWTRDAEADTWQQVTTRPIALRITSVNGETALRESGGIDLGVTHMGRCRPNSNLQSGVRLVREDDGQEYVVLNVRTQAAPPPTGMAVLLLRAVEAATD